MLRVGGVFIYKDMASRPLWAVAANHIHDLIFARQWVRITPLSGVERMAREAGFVKVAELKARVLWYSHEMLVLEKQDSVALLQASPPTTLSNR